MKMFLTLATAVSITISTLNAVDLKSAIETPDAKKIIKNDLLGSAKVYSMPKGCISTDSDVIARGAFIFHNLNGKQAKQDAPKGLAKKLSNGKPKQYGNCVACHNIENAVGAGNIGPDLNKYRDYFVDTGLRKPEWVYQKIADARIDNPDTHMTINLTTALFSEREICDITSYIISKK